ncbi:hypothetical protein A5651_12745 [Mycobacterium sp. 1274761.0]|nr:hypothetical protein A5651_12745 [Mycobacterium sp. 1274761.0]
MQHDKGDHDKTQRGGVGDPGCTERQHRHRKFGRTDQVDQQILRPLDREADQRRDRRGKHRQHDRARKGDHAVDHQQDAQWAIHVGFLSCHTAVSRFVTDMTMRRHRR